MPNSSTEDQLTLTEVREMWTFLSPAERLEAFVLLPREEAQEFFLMLSSGERRLILSSLAEGERRLWMRLLPPDDAADVIQTASQNERAGLLTLLDEKTRIEVSALLSYKQDVAGGLMNPRFARIRPDMTIDEAIRYLRLQAQESTTGVYYLFVLDETQQLLGIVSFQDLFRAPAEKKVSEIMKTEVVTVQENQDKDTVAQLFEKYKYLALPVIDARGRIKGVITADDVMQVVKDSVTEDIQKMGGMQALEKPYLQVNFFHMMSKRAGWLAALFLGEMLTTSAMSHFEEQISRAVVLALFVPLIISSGGNTGSQASTLVIRAMALGEVRLKDWWQVVYRELGMGLGLGLILAVIGFLRIFLWQMLFQTYGEHYLSVALSVSVSLVGVVLLGSMAGSVLPLVLRKFGFDPASASAPFVATLVDVSGVLIYFTISGLLLRGIMN